MKVERLYNIIRELHVTEKTTRIGRDSNQYGFKVAPDASKSEVKKAVEKLFSVDVLKVTTVNYHAKAKLRRRASNGRIRVHKGHTKSWKKAYVRIKDGQSIDVTELE
ncbi:MAG: 50S ribosomal protein L23 [Gammaproteobacteria bacterium]|nr:50S ribosomal protein L23 [Gammaproteobacteria bacterium]